MEKMRRFSSCRGVSFEIKSPAIYPSCDKESTNQQAQNLHLPWSYRTSSEVFPSSINVQKISITRSSSRPSRHFCDLDDEENNEEEEEEVHHDIEQPRSVSAPSKRFQQPPEVIIRRKQSRLSVILLDQGLFTVYKRLFMVCLAINVVCLVLSAIAFSPYPRKHATLFSIANILALTLCRSEAFLRVIFWLAVKVLGRPSVPLSFKTATTSFLQCLGGVHSGCGVSSVIWLVYSLVLTLKDRDSTSTAIISVASTILALLCFSCLAAFPLVRHLHHNVFERTHRFAGWTALLLVWAFIFLTISYNPITKSYDNLHFTKLMKEQEFWFTFSITIVIILPWVTVRRVPVRVSAQSGHASIIKFDGGVKAGLLGRISTSPLSEWHAFGIISDGKNEHMMLAGAVGDFTKSLVTKPPRHLWVRQVHFAGLPYLVNLYNKVLLVATGSGICVFLSFLMQPSSAEVSLLWVAKGIEQNFGKEITEAVKGFPKDKVIVHDSAVSGRPNVSQMSIDAAKKWGAEVVIVTSNPEGSRDVVNACKDAGITAFGPIWDS